MDTSYVWRSSTCSSYEDKRLHLPAPISVQKDIGLQKHGQLPADRGFSNAHRTMNQNQVFHTVKIPL